MSEGLEELKRMAYENACCRCQYYKDKECTNKGNCVWKTIEINLKALEIIKEKPQASFFMFIHKEDFRNEEYGFCSLLTKELTQEEYELLKEVLL